MKKKEKSLERSSALLGEHPKDIKILETLNIFAVRANYMTQFREYLEREGVETEPVIELPLFTWLNEKAIQEKQLLVPRVPEDKGFHERVVLVLGEGEGEHIGVRVDLSVKVQAMESMARGLHVATVQSGAERRIPEESLALVDWEQVYLDLLDYNTKRARDGTT